MATAHDLLEPSFDADRPHSWLPGMSQLTIRPYNHSLEYLIKEDIHSRLNEH